MATGGSLVPNEAPNIDSLLGGSWVVISGVISPLIWVITIVTLLITPLIPNHEPPSISTGQGAANDHGLTLNMLAAKLWA